MGEKDKGWFEILSIEKINLINYKANILIYS